MPYGRMHLMPFVYSSQGSKEACTPLGESSLARGDCSRNGKNMYGKVKVVTSFADIKVQVANSFPALKVQKVSSFPHTCGEWQFVGSFPDFTLQYVNSFPDLKVQFVDSFPGR